jgi:hypothetical protein
MHVRESFACQTMRIRCSHLTRSDTRDRLAPHRKLGRAPRPKQPSFSSALASVAALLCLSSPRPRPTCGAAAGIGARRAATDRELASRCSFVTAAGRSGSVPQWEREPASRSRAWDARRHWDRGVSTLLTSSRRFAACKELELPRCLLCCLGVCLPRQTLSSRKPHGREPCCRRRRRRCLGAARESSAAASDRQAARRNAPPKHQARGVSNQWTPCARGGRECPQPSAAMCRGGVLSAAHWALPIDSQRTHVGARRRWSCDVAATILAPRTVSNIDLCGNLIRPHRLLPLPDTHGSHHAGSSTSRVT